MAKQTLTRWDVYIVRAKLQWLGEVDASSAEEAMKTAAAKWRHDVNRLTEWALPKPPRSMTCLN
jgi:hypothetical protein